MSYRFGKLINSPNACTESFGYVYESPNLMCHPSLFLCFPHVSHTYTNSSVQCTHKHKIQAWIPIFKIRLDFSTTMRITYGLYKRNHCVLGRFVVCCTISVECARVPPLLRHAMPCLSYNNQFTLKSMWSTTTNRSADLIWMNLCCRAKKKMCLVQPHRIFENCRIGRACDFIYTNTFGFFFGSWMYRVHTLRPDVMRFYACIGDMCV